MTVANQTVREIALEQPGSIRVFERFGIDYCCGGRKPLSEACAAKDVEIDVVIAALEAAAQTPAEVADDWNVKSLTHLCGYIVAKHHAYVKRELPRLATLAEKVVNRHGATRPELPIIQATLVRLDEELTQHLAKEEIVLFPHISRLERAIADGGEKPNGCFGTVANPIAMIWSGALMLDFLGHSDAHDAIVRAIERVLVDGPRTGDLGGKASTTEVGKAIAAMI